MANDVLIGGNGIDTLEGGAGVDTMTGGIDGDTFVYSARSDSGVTVATRDVITDFTQGTISTIGDKIDLSLIDANANLANDQAFAFIGTNVNWGGVAGQLRAVWTATGQIVEADTRDEIADFSIKITDATHAITFGNGDFIL